MKRTISVLFIPALSLPLLSQAAQFAQNPQFGIAAKPKKVLLLKPQIFVAKLSADDVAQSMDIGPRTL
jgi:hypothetical protein